MTRVAELAERLERIERLLVISTKEAFNVVRPLKRKAGFDSPPPHNEMSAAREQGEKERDVCEPPIEGLSSKTFNKLL